ncbi:MAG TPA: hypothetical protein VH988_07975 [Thermoanaerobaculia bacterium]|nr:hypothetical protein [Thermoanaerobaculia bacterium]
MEYLKTTEGGRRVHPPERTLRRFVLGTTSPTENRAIVAHLLRQCGCCSRVLAESGGEILKFLRQSAERAS